MASKYILRYILLFLFSSSFLVLKSQLNTFFEDWEPRTFNHYSNVDLQSELNLPASVVVNINTSNTIADVLPSHFGTNLTHFLGQSVINENDFMSNLKNLGKAILRYPGGNGSNQFFWDGNIPSNILNDSQITINDLIDGSGWRISPNEFVQILDSTNGSGIIAVNASYARYGTSANPIQTAASYAASFVRHMNQTLNANIKYWEVGNENYGPWQAGYLVNGDTIDGIKYGDIFNVFADSMKAADPTIKIGAVLFRQDGVYNDWSKKVLSKVENKADYLIIHNYFRRKPNPNNVSYQEMLTSLNQVQQDVIRVENMVAAYTNKPSDYFPIAMTEFNSKTGEREISMANAIFITQALAEQIKNGFAASILWSFQNGLDNYGGDHGMTARNSPILNDHYPRPVFYIYHFFQKFMGDRMVWSYSSDSTVKSYVSTFSSDTRGIVLVNNSSISKTVNLDFGSDTIRYNYYWYEVYANNETDKKIFVNDQTSNFVEGGPENYASIPPYFRPVNGNNKFELKPYSVNFIANSDYLLGQEELENSLDLRIYPNPFNEVLNIDQQYEFDHLKLYDIKGKLVLQSSKKSIDTKLLKEGVYILKLYNDQSSTQIKIIKVKK
jgi:hypothetical protein